MRRALAVVLVVCCVLSGTALAVPVTDSATRSADRVVPTTNATASLQIGSDTLETTAYRRATLDVSATLALDSRRLDGKFRQRVLDARASRAADTGARRRQLTRNAASVEAGITRLREREAAAVRAYNNDSTSARAFVVELAYVDTAARRLETAANRVADRAESVPGARIDGQSVASWQHNRQIELGPLEGPVRDRIAETLRGENTVRIGDAAASGLDEIGPVRHVRLEPLRLYIETSATGVVLATIDDGNYYREAYLPGVRNNTTTGGELTGRDAFDRVKARYPWAWNHSGSTTSRGDRRAGVYQVTLGHDHGQLTTYLNQTSGRVFAEQQRNRLSSLPTADPVSSQTPDLRLRVNRTYPTGPLELSLSTADGDPVDGHITIDNRSVGPTGTDGRRWTVAPRGTFTVVAHVNGETVRVETNAAPRANRTARAGVTVPVGEG